MKMTEQRRDLAARARVAADDDLAAIVEAAQLWEESRSKTSTGTFLGDVRAALARMGVRS